MKTQKTNKNKPVKVITMFTTDWDYHEPESCDECGGYIIEGGCYCDTKGNDKYDLYNKIAQLENRIEMLEQEDET